MTSTKSADGADYGWLKGSVGPGLLDLSVDMQEEKDGKAWTTVAVINASADEDASVGIALPRSAGQGTGGGGVDGWECRARQDQHAGLHCDGQTFACHKYAWRSGVCVRESTWDWDWEKPYTFP